MDDPFPFGVGYFELAKNASKYSTHPRCKMGCVIANHKPKGIGFNIHEKTHTIYCNPVLTFHRGIHCEIMAMNNTGKNNIKNAVAYVYRELKNGRPACARPCEYCMKALKEFGCKRVYYSVDTYPYYRMEKI